MDAAPPQLWLKTMKTLLVTAALLAAGLAFVPSANADPLDPPPCMDVYSRTDVGTTSIVRRNSCSAEVYTCPDEGADLRECRPLLG